MLNLPKWVWFLLWLAAILIILVLLRVDIHIGGSGISINQGLVR